MSIVQGRYVHIAFPHNKVIGARKFGISHIDNNVTMWTYIIMLTRGERKTTFELKKVINVAAVLTSNHGQVATASTAQKICPRVML